MSERIKLACEIASRTEPRFIDTNPKPKPLGERLALAREIPARTPPRFITIPPERGGGKVRTVDGDARRAVGGAISAEDDTPVAQARVLSSRAVGSGLPRTLIFPYFSDSYVTERS
jgi:hypothetical protein